MDWFLYENDLRHERVKAFLLRIKSCHSDWVKPNVKDSALLPTFQINDIKHEYVERKSREKTITFWQTNKYFPLYLLFFGSPISVNRKNHLTIY